MLRTRIIPALLLRNESLVKTRQFGRYVYVGDPCNTVRIFNELEVDELMFLDITATREKRAPNFKLLNDIANECFMPLAYGGGINNVEDARQILSIGFEKIVINSAALSDPSLINALSDQFGSQAVVVAIDVRAPWPSRRPRVFSHAGTLNTGLDPVDWAKEAARHGAGEILLTSIAREGGWSGFDEELICSVASTVSIPVIAHGGAGSPEHVRSVITHGQASAVAVGSMVVFQKRGMGILVNFSDCLRKVVEQ